MQVPAIDPAIQAALPTAAGVPVRVVGGNLALVPLGALLQATVTSVTPRDASLLVNGQQLTVRQPPGVQLQPGAVLLVRVPPTAPNAPNPTVELSAPPATAGTAPRVPAGTANVTPSLPDAVGRATNPVTTPSVRITPDAAKLATPAGAPRLAVVDVLNALPDGRVRVQIDGEEQVAASAQPLTPGSRYVLQVERTPAGLALKPPPDSPKLEADVATAILRTPTPGLPATLKPLQAELATFTTPQPTGTSPPVPPAVRDAAVAVRDTLNSFLPTEPRTPDAQELQKLVENGGLHYEAKLARFADPEAAPARSEAPKAESPEAQATNDKSPASTSTTNDRNTTSPDRSTSEPPAASQAANRALGTDLKGDLLRLLQTVQDLGGTVQAPAAQTALHGIEAQQATNTLAQTNAAPYLLQIPFPDGQELRTLSLSLEPQNRPDQPDAEQAGRFRMLMHVPLSDLGETWIDAGLAGDKFRATIYLDRAAIRDRVRAALPELRTELQSDGFSEVLLDVRASDELPSRQKREASAMQAGRPNTVSVLDVRA